MQTLSAELRPHPSAACNAIRRIGVAIGPGPAPGELRIGYRIEGDMPRLLLPLADNPRRCDGLWQHSCFEAFLRADARDSYFEFNFAPSLAWAAYRFDGRRAGRSSPELPAPSIAFQLRGDHCALTADLPTAAHPELAAAGVIHAGLAAVVETRDGALSYWSLEHGGAQPDFHDPATFRLALALR